MSVDLLNRALRPMAIAGIAAAAIFFLFGLAAILLYRFATFGEIDFQGLAAFGSLVLLPVMQHFQNRHQIKRDQVLINTPPLTNVAAA